jgi:hypothetical protein
MAENNNNNNNNLGGFSVHHVQAKLTAHMDSMDSLNDAAGIELDTDILETIIFFLMNVSLMTVRSGVRKSNDTL